MANTTTPFPSTLLKSASPPMAIASPVERNERAVVPLALGPFPLAQGSGNLPTGLHLSRLAPFGGRILGIDAFWTTAGAGAGAAGTIKPSSTACTSLAAC